jgi:hypothetical protein
MRILNFLVPFIEFHVHHTNARVYRKLKNDKFPNRVPPIRAFALGQ